MFTLTEDSKNCIFCIFQKIMKLKYQEIVKNPEKGEFKMEIRRNPEEKIFMNNFREEEDKKESMWESIKEFLKGYNLQKSSYTLTKLIILTDGISLDENSFLEDLLLNKLKYIGFSSILLLVGC